MELSSSEIACLSDLQSQPFQIKRGTEIAHEGQIARRAFILQSGMGQLLQSIRQRRADCANDFLSTAWRFHGTGQYSAAIIEYSLVSLHLDVVVSSCSRGPCLMKLFEKFPRVAAAILWSASRDEAMVIEHLVNVGRRSAIERVAHCLLELRQRLHLVGLASESQFECPLTQYDLADALGLSPIHVNRVLRFLREEGLLTVKSHTVFVHDLAGLTRLAGFDSPISTKSSPKKLDTPRLLPSLTREDYLDDLRLAQR